MSSITTAMTANANYRTAILCGAIPLATGTTIFLLWLMTHWPWLMPAGIVTIYLGVPLVFFGIMTMTEYWASATNSGIPRRTRILRVLLCLGLLLVNFPAAYGIVLAVNDIQTSYRVTIRNNSSKPLENVELLGPGCEEQIGTVLPRKTVRRKLRFQGEGPLILCAVSEGQKHHVTLHGYITSALGGSSEVTVNRDGALTIWPPVR